MRKYKIRKDLKASLNDTENFENYDFFLVDYISLVDCYRIEALKNFSDVKKGDLGGFVECYNNLSQKDDCWLYSGFAIASAEIRDGAKVYNSIITGTSRISGRSEIRDSEIQQNSYYYSEIFDSNIYNSIIDNSRPIYDSIVSNSTVHYNDMINYNNVHYILDPDKSDKVKYLFHLANILPVNNIYTFFIQNEESQVAPCDLVLPIKLAHIDHFKVDAVEVDIKYLEIIDRDRVRIHRIKSIKPLTAEDEQLNISKLDLILED
jgi:hypothetical protein